TAISIFSSTMRGSSPSGRPMKQRKNCLRGSTHSTSRRRTSSSRNWLLKLRRTVRLQRTRLPKPLSSWLRIVPVSFMGQSSPLMEGALPFEVCGRHGGHTKNMNVSMTVNGSVQAITVEPRMTLLDALRDVLRLTGPKKACDRGECGACTVLIEGRRVLSCMTLAVMHDGQRIGTIEGLEH